MKLQIVGLFGAALIASVAGQAVAGGGGWEGNAYVPKGFLNGQQWSVGLASAAGNVPVWDRDLANIVKPFAASGVDLSFAFSQCYGGGMISDLMALPAASGNLNARIAATSAVKWNQAASYPKGFLVDRRVPLLTGAAVVKDHFFDWADSYITYSPNNTALGNANNARRTNPLGSNAGAAAGNVDQGPVERVSRSEVEQYDSTNAAADNIIHNTVAANKRFAILWSGQPNDVDAAQISREYNQLIVNGYNNNNIRIMFGTGAADPVAATLPGAALVRAATKDNLALLLDTTVGTFGSVLVANDQLFFFANDHGTAWHPDMPPNMWIETPKYGGESNLPYLPGDLDGPTLPPLVPTPGAALIFGVAGIFAARRRR